MLKLKLQADLDIGWRQCPLGSCFSEQAWTDVFGGQRVRTQLSVFTRPRGTYPESPNLHASHGVRGGFGVIAIQHLVLLSVDLIDRNHLNEALPWALTRKGKPFLQMRVDESELTQVTLDGVEVDERPIPYGVDIRALVVVQSPPARPAPVYRDWFRRFLPGGLPELGRR